VTCKHDSFDGSAPADTSTKTLRSVRNCNIGPEAGAALGAGLSRLTALRVLIPLWVLLIVLHTKTEEECIQVQLESVALRMLIFHCCSIVLAMTLSSVRPGNLL
jgi:hypothetical protein